MKIVEEDLIDWEPLQMQFNASVELADEQHEAFGVFLEKWFQTNAGAERSDCDIRYWTIDAQNLTASCEHLTRSALRRLVRAVDRRFPQIDLIRIGIAFEGVPSGLDFKWISFSDPQVEMDNESYQLQPFAIAIDQVSFGQFSEFMSCTSYVPDCDTAEYSGYLESNMKLNWGKSPKIPVFGVTFNDATAFCEWANVRLPTEPEIHHFFVRRATEGKQPDWTGDCWTSTIASNGNYVLRNGPYPPTIEMSVENFRSNLPASHFDFPFPVFRVARSLESR